MMTKMPDLLQTLPTVKRARLFLVLCTAIFSLWVIAMLLMYFLTVYPQRHHAAAQLTAASRSIR